MDRLYIQNIIENQKSFFKTGETKQYTFRLKHLKLLKKALIENEHEIIAALKKDLNKPEAESYLSEVYFLINEINYTIKNLSKWMNPQKVRTPFILFPSKSYIYSEPFGVSLIIAPWNYPFQLLFGPLIGSIAAGNCSILKPSEKSGYSAKVISQIVQKYFDPLFITVIAGGIEESQFLLSQKFDYIFYSGSASVGKLIMEKAAQNLTPVTLELGGKSPCIVDENIDIKKTVKRIIWGKFVNAGQTCIVPDYLVLHKNIKDRFIAEIKNCINEFYGTEPMNSFDFARIIDIKHFNRLCDLLNEGDILVGGKTDEATLYLSPTVISNISWDSNIMKEEIFGPILPILDYSDIDEVIEKINERPKPLSLYLFSKNKSIQKKVINNSSSGGLAINDVLVHISSPRLPFGGVGGSGIGNYHGKWSFDTFSHKKGLLKNSFMVDFKLRYPPYPKLSKFLKGMINILNK